MACCKCRWNYIITKCSFFNVTLLGNSVRVGKVFPVGFFCAVQPPLAWRVKLSRLNQLRSPCKPVRCAPKMLQFTHVPPSHTYVPSPEVPRRASLRPPTVASHAPLGHPRPSLTQHTPCGIPGWPSQARVGRRWPVAAAPCRRGSRWWWCRRRPRTPPPSFRCNTIGEQRTGWQGLPSRFFLCSATPP